MKSRVGLKSGYTQYLNLLLHLSMSEHSAGVNQDKCSIWTGLPVSLNVRAFFQPCTAVAVLLARYMLFEYTVAWPLRAEHCWAKLNMIMGQAWITRVITVVDHVGMCWFYSICVRPVYFFFCFVFCLLFLFAFGHVLTNSCLFAGIWLLVIFGRLRLCSWLFNWLLVLIFVFYVGTSSFTTNTEHVFFGTNSTDPFLMLLCAFFHCQALGLRLVRFYHGF